MSPEVSRLLEILAERSLLPERKLAKLRRQLEEKRQRGKRVPLESLAKLLVDKGHLTQRQANSLINEIAEEGHYQGVPEGEELALRPIEGEELLEETPRSPNRDDYLSESKFYEEGQELSEAEAAALPKPVNKRRNWSAPDAASGVPADQARRPVASPLDDLPTSAETPSGRRRSKKDAARSEWESPLILAGGGGLLLLLLVGTLVWYLLRTDTADAHLRAAREAYVDGAYAQAVQSYEAFLEAHSDHEEASSARVHLGLARLRRSLESGAGPEVLLEQAQSMIAQTEQEAAFSEAGRELAAVLPMIAEGLAQQASEAGTPEAAVAYSAKTQDALALLTNTKYVPKSFRPTESIENVERTLASVERRQARQQVLSAALADIRQARQEKRFQQAYETYGSLIDSYADVAELPEVRGAVAEVAAAEAAELSFQEDPRSASREDRDTAAVETILLSTALQQATDADGGDPSTAFVRIDGAVYGIDVASGELLWRRFVGHADLPPLPTPDGDALVFDAEHKELLRLAGRDGELVWRQPIGDVVGNAVVHKDRVFVPTAESRLLAVDLASGQMQGFIQFAQPLATTPTLDSASNRVLVVGEQSILYLLSADELRSEDAVFVGHVAGSVRVPAAAVGDTVCIAENFAVNRSRLHVLSAGKSPGASPDAEKDEPAATIQARIEPIRLTGRVTTPMVVDGRRLALATDVGEIRVFNVTTGAEGPPLSPVASRDARDDASSDHYLALRDSDLWLAGSRLMRLKVLATGGRLQPQDLPRVYAGDAFVHPLLTAGDRLIHVRRPQGMAGHLVAATSAQSGEQLWERELATPATDLSVLPGESGLAVATAGGRMYLLPGSSGGDSAKQALSSQPIAPQGIATVEVGEGWSVAQSLAVEDKLRGIAVKESEVSVYELDLPSQVAAAPRRLGGGVVVPLQLGQVFWVDAVSGEALTTPFQPPINPRRLPEWTPASIVESDRSFVIADRPRCVYLVEVERQREPGWLRMAAQSPPVTAPIAGDLCVMPPVVLAAAGHRLLRFRLPELTEDSAVELSETIVWGPVRAAGAALVATADDRLHCLDSEGRVHAAASISAAVVGRPLAIDHASTLIALEDGSLLRVNVETGSIEAHGSLGQPLATGPIQMGGYLYVATGDGALVRQPWTAPAALAAARVPH